MLSFHSGAFAPDLRAKYGPAVNYETVTISEILHGRTKTGITVTFHREMCQNHSQPLAGICNPPLSLVGIDRFRASPRLSNLI